MNRKSQRQDFIDAARRCGLLSACNDSDLDEVAGLAMCHDYPKNNVLLYAGDPARAVFLVVSGAVKVSLMNEEAKEVVIGIERTGGLIGLVPLLDGGVQPANAVTIAPSRLARFSGPELLSWVERRRELSTALQRELASAVRQAYQKIGEHALLSVKERLLYTLLEIAEQEGELGPEGAWIFTRPTHQELADRIGSSREVVSRLLKELLESELLEAEGKVIRVSESALVLRDE
jgi:CRP/FNR family cyclic AMP-dependent transcriptional regulator